MLENITNRFETIFNKLNRKGRLSEKNIREGVREIKLALLEADINYKVVKDFVKDIEKAALGAKIVKTVSPTQQFIKVVHDKLIEIMGEHAEEIILKKQGISTILMVGLQGAGKTTTSAKLGYFLKDKRRVLLVGADTYRAAAQQQLKILAEENELGFFTDEQENNPVNICKKALKFAQQNDYHTIIFDSAGRLQIDEVLMTELVKIKKIVEPDEILFVADAMAGQSIVDVVKEFDKLLDISGIILTKFDSDARGGAALSITKTTGKMIKFIGVGEKIENLERFYPDRIAGRILGKGDIVSFVEKAQAVIDSEDAQKMEERFLKNKFDLDDFLSQIRQVKKMGSLQSLADMLPLPKGAKMGSANDRNLAQTEAILLSMTPKERRNYRILSSNRRRRIAMGSGTKILAVNRLIKQFEDMQKLMKQFKKNPAGMEGLMNQFQDIQ